MATLIAFVFVLDVVLLGMLFGEIVKIQKNHSNWLLENASALAVFGPVVVAYGIHWDIYGAWPEWGFSILPTAALVALGLYSLALLLLRMKPTGRLSSLPRRGSGLVWLVLEVIGLVASVLGILSFYLDHLG